MKGLFRNCFLQLGAFALAVLILSGCGARRIAPVEPVVPLSPQQTVRLPLMGYAIQVGAFNQVENAARLTARLTRQGLAAYYYREARGLYRVRFANLATSAQAVILANKLRQGGVIEVYTVIRPQSYPALLYRGQDELIRGELVRVAQQFIGVPYQWGESRPGEGFDCSGLTMMVYQLIGLDMPRISKEQYRVGRPLTTPEMRPGDLVFFATAPGGQVSHVGIYVGDGLFVHAPGSGRTVSRASLTSTYFRKHYLGARAYL
jgi:cell wall-associated NlpC family hydrolase